MSVEQGAVYEAREGSACPASQVVRRGSFHVDVDRLSAPSLPPASRDEIATRPLEGVGTPPPPASFRTATRDWCVDTDSTILTLSTFELWEALERGQVVSWMRVWREGMECWTPVGEISEFAWAMAQTPQPGDGPTDAPPANPALAAMTAPPRASGVRALSDPGGGRRWIALGSVIAASAVGGALLVPSEPTRVVAQPGAAEVVMAPRAREGRASVHVRAATHDERGQRRLPRAGRALGEP